MHICPASQSEAPRHSTQTPAVRSHTNRSAEQSRSETQRNDGASAAGTSALAVSMKPSVPTSTATSGGTGFTASRSPSSDTSRARTTSTLIASPPSDGNPLGGVPVALQEHSRNREKAAKVVDRDRIAIGYHHAI
jgi:hypothetical protein